MKTLASSLFRQCSWLRTLTLSVIVSAVPVVAGAAGLRVGAAAVPFKADDSMVIGGSIQGGKLKGQEGELRAVAVVLQKDSVKVAVVACDVLMLTRDLLDPVAAEIEKTTGIPAAHLLVNATHTHHAPSTVTVHGYTRVEEFCKEVQRGVVKAVQQANANLSAEDCRFFFRLGEEPNVGENSRKLLSDGSIFWIGQREDVVRPTGPFDPELPVLAFRDAQDRMKALIFNHSTHTIGIRKGGRSPSFYGLAAQELETELGGPVSFLEGASGSTHRLSGLVDEAIQRVKTAVKGALTKAEERPVTRLASLKRPLKFKVRNFDEAREDAAVLAYCTKRAGGRSDATIDVFRQQRKILAPQRGQERETWVQVVLIGDVALVGVPAEFFTKLGLDIKNRSPFRYTYVAELANDWIGYLPDLEAHKLGGYQVWTGLHSYAEPGTGERVVDQAVAMLHELAGKKELPR